MALPILPPPGEIFKGAGLRNYLRTSGKGIFDAFPKANDALNFIKSNLGAIRRQDFLTIRRQVLNIAKGPRQLDDYDKNALIPMKWHKQDHGLSLSSEYQYRIELVGTDPKTGSIKTQWMTVATDTQMNTSDVQDVARTYAGEGGDSAGIIIAAFGEIIPIRR